jgi:hypothetical protein
MSPEKDLPLFGYYYFRTSLPFYLRRPVGLITTDASETTSNYVSEQWLRVRRGDGGSGLSSSKSQPGQTLAAGGPPVLFDIFEVRALSFRQPALILVRNTQVWELGVAFEQVDPLLSGWECSVWKVGGSGNR